VLGWGFGVEDYVLFKTKCGKSVIVDDDLDLSRFSKKISLHLDYGYPMAWDKRRGRTVRIHRIILDVQRGQIVDHINGNRLDNRRENLRVVTAKQNALNRLVKGWTYVKRLKKPFVAMVKVAKGVSLHLGCFATKEEAIAAYKSYYDSQPSEFKPRIISETA
jgi:hypothetical protein